MKHTSTASDRVPLRKKIFAEEPEEPAAYNENEISDKKIRMNVWISPENMEFLRAKSEHSGTNVTVLCSLAISNYCDDERAKYAGIDLYSYKLTHEKALR